MLKNAPTLAIRGVDAAENEPTFEPMARAGSRADGFLRALLRTHAGEPTGLMAAPLGVTHVREAPQA